MKNSKVFFMGTVALGLLYSYVGAEDVTPPTVTGPFYECTNMTGSIQSATFSVKKKLVLNTINHSVSTIQGTPAEQSALSGGTLDSVAINTGNVVTTLTGEVPKGITLENGILYVGSHVSVGTYNVSVQTCEKENSTNCVLSTVEVIVQPVPVFTGTATATGSQVFFSRTCPEGREPKAETYNANETVEATGSTQAEADALAKELAKKAIDKDIKDNGQLFADTYGKCVKKEIPTPPIVELPHTGPSITLGTGKQEVYTDDTIDFSFETQSGSMYTAFLCNASEEEMKKTYNIDSEAQGLSGVQQFTALTDVCEQVYAENASGSKVELSLSSDNMKNTKILSDVGEKSFYVIKGGCTEREVRCSDFGYGVEEIRGEEYDEYGREYQNTTRTEKYIDPSTITITKNERGTRVIKFTDEEKKFIGKEDSTDHRYQKGLKHTAYAIFDIQKSTRGGVVSYNLNEIGSTKDSHHFDDIEGGYIGLWVNRQTEYLLKQKNKCFMKQIIIEEKWDNRM